MEFKEKLKDIGKICIPGMRLSESNKEFVSGSGTYELKGYIYASLAGVLIMEEDENSKVYNTNTFTHTPQKEIKYSRNYTKKYLCHKIEFTFIFIDFKFNVTIIKQKIIFFVIKSCTDNKTFAL